MKGGHHVQFPGCADREVDECSSAGSESCWGETEDIGDDEVVEWGALPLHSSIAQAVPAPHVVDCDRVAHRAEHQGSQGRLVAASSPPSSQNRFVPYSSRTVRRLRLVSNNANSVDDSAPSVLVEPVHGEVSQDVPRVVPVVNMARDDSESDIRVQSLFMVTLIHCSMRTRQTWKPSMAGKSPKWGWRIQCPKWKRRK